MGNKIKRNGENCTAIRFMLTVGLAMGILLAAIFLFISDRALEQIISEVHKQAEIAFEQVVITRHWNADYGGVYVEKTKGVESNQYLKKLGIEPDITSVDNRKYTLKNPALMTRELSEIAKEGKGLEFHITSLDLVNPSNAPDTFEKQALMSFEKGATEAKQVVRRNGLMSYRYMAPLYVEKGCLKCHKNYKPKDVRGGISVFLPMENVYTAIRTTKKNLLVAGIGLIFGVEILLFFLINRLIVRPMNELRVGAMKIGAGNLDYRIPAKGNDEIGALGTAFNKITADMAKNVRNVAESEAKFRAIFTEALEGIVLIDSESGSIIDCNPAFEQQTGREPNSLKRIKIWEIWLSEEVGAAEAKFHEIVRKGIGGSDELEFQKPDGKIVPIEFVAKMVTIQEKLYILSTTRDLSERKQADAALRESEERLKTTLDSIQAGIVVIDAETHIIVNANPAAIRRIGAPEEQVIGHVCHKYICPAEKGKCPITDLGQKVDNSERILLTANGKEIPIIETVTSILLGGKECLLNTFIDITEKRKLESQLRQAQKMEAIGTLAGGVAHDFNNLLTVIIGNAQLVLMDAGKDGPLYEEIKEIKKAGERAASLTRQLLAFSRKQIIQPKILDINELLTDIEMMIGRLIGEDIELLTILEPELWQVEIDPGQIEQVIINLAINARDVMLQGGKLTIETANADLNENYFREHSIEGEKPGQYVMLAVSDTGSGMDKETQGHIFDPFFTTKEVGKGTGLGLSTVYGIVKQNNGFVWVYSEPGQGTTFKVYLPEVKKDADPEKKEQIPVDDPCGFETVLIAEDNDLLRNFAQKALLSYGYRVMVAENGEDALSVCKEHDGQIDLMITDVIMPKMGGREAAKRLQHLYPQMKVIYMSGYTDDAIVHHGVLEPGLNFLEKPFTPKGLARKAREALDE